MRFLVDENVFPKITFHLRSLGHDVKALQEEGLTGIIHIRIHPPLLEDVLLAIDNLFKRYKPPSFRGKLIVLSRTGYRVR